jgi:hypothetical protein
VYGVSYKSYVHKQTHKLIANAKREKWTHKLQCWLSVSYMGIMYIDTITYGIQCGVYTLISSSISRTAVISFTIPFTILTT